MNRSHAFQYLKRDLAWPEMATRFHLEQGADGRITLARVPRLTAEVSAALAPEAPLRRGPTPCPDPGSRGAAAAPAPAPAGLATGGLCSGDLYASDPVCHQIWRMGACDAGPRPLPCLRGPGPWPGQLDTPRGLAITRGPEGERLFIAEAGNHRVQVVDLATQQPLAVWGQGDPQGLPEAGAGPGRLDDPWDLAADAEGNLYVVDHGNRRVQKFTPRGDVDATFAQTIAARGGPPIEPARVACAGPPGDGRVLVLDRGATPARVVVLDPYGALQAPGAWDVGEVPGPIALAASGEAVYVGGADGTIATYDRLGRWISTWPGTGRPLAALTAGRAGELLAGPGGMPVARLAASGGFLPSGHFVAGPFPTLARALDWHRWRVEADPLGPEVHVQLFTFVGRDATPPAGLADPVSPFSADGWAAHPRDELDVLVLSDPVRAALAAGPVGDPAEDVEGSPAPNDLWLGGLLRGDGLSSPVLHQMRIDYAPGSYLRELPEIYREGPRRRLLLDLILATLGNEVDRVEEVLDGLGRLFDPAGAPAPALPWLASWLDFDLVEDWSDADTRRAIAEAVALSALRGTAIGLRRYLKLYAGVEARVEEPGAASALFSLDDRVSLGINSRLAPAHEQGAVLASTATLGQSHLIDAADMGVPLFADVAHRFCVQVYAAEVADPRIRQRVVDVLERERPAHTQYHLCVIGPTMRVGFQARVGIDTIVAGPTPEMRLGEPVALGVDTALADQPRHSCRLGRGVRVGGTL